MGDELTLLLVFVNYRDKYTLWKHGGYSMSLARYVHAACNE
jgi:hypothetical protein